MTQPTNSKRRRVWTTLPDELDVELRVIAARERKTIGEIFADCVRAYMQLRTGGGPDVGPGAR